MNESTHRDAVRQHLAETIERARAVLVADRECTPDHVCAECEKLGFYSPVSYETRAAIHRGALRAWLTYMADVAAGVLGGDR